MAPKIICFCSLSFPHVPLLVCVGGGGTYLAVPALLPLRVSRAEGSSQSATQSIRDEDHCLALCNQWAELQWEFRIMFGINPFQNNTDVSLETELIGNAFEGRQHMKQAWKLTHTGSLAWKSGQSRSFHCNLGILRLTAYLSASVAVCTSVMLWAYSMQLTTA